MTDQDIAAQLPRIQPSSAVPVSERAIRRALYQKSAEKNRARARRYQERKRAKLRAFQETPQ